MAFLFKFKLKLIKLYDNQLIDRISNYIASDNKNMNTHMLRRDIMHPILMAIHICN